MEDKKPPVSYTEFSAKIKSQYPEYKDVDDLVLAQKMVEKYPEYKESVTFETSETGAKKKYGRFIRACQAFIAEWKS